MSVASEIERIKGNIASAYTSASGKGATMPDVQNSANLAGCIDTIAGGGATDEWRPNPLWPDIKSLVENDTREYAGKVGVIMYNFSDVSNFTLTATDRAAIATSDGAFYTYADNGGSITHNWDTSQDVDDGAGAKTRWIIYYYTTDTTNDVFRSTQSQFGWVGNLIAYLVLRINCSTAENFCNGQSLLQGIDNEGYSISGRSFYSFLLSAKALKKFPDSVDISNGNNFISFCSGCYALRKINVLGTNVSGNFTSFCSECYALQEIPENFYTGGSTNFSGYCNKCYALIKIPDTLDTTNGTNFANFCAECYYLQKLPDNLNTRKGTLFNNFCHNCYALKSLPEGLDISSGSNFSYFCTQVSSVTKTPIMDFSNTSTAIAAYNEPFANSTRLVTFLVILPSATNFYMQDSTKISIESFRFVADQAPDVTAKPRTLYMGSTNISRCNAADPTIITDLNAKGWSVA